MHTYLCNQGLRERCSLVVQAGDVQEGHDIACLVAFGADEVHPYLMLRLVRNGLTFKDPDTKQTWTLSGRECLENVFAALEDTFKKIISKMGITTIEGYRGARLFEAVGFGPELTAFLGEFPSRVGGIGLGHLVEDSAWRLAQAEKMQVLGRNRDYHGFNAKVRMALRKAAIAGSAGLPLAGEDDHPREERSEEGGEAAYADRFSPDYQEFSRLVNNRVASLRIAGARVPARRLRQERDSVRVLGPHGDGVVLSLRVDAASGEIGWMPRSAGARSRVAWLSLTDSRSAASDC